MATDPNPMTKAGTQGNTQANAKVQAETRAAARLASTPTAVTARYDRRVGRVVVALSTGLEIAFKPHDAQGLQDARPAQLHLLSTRRAGLRPVRLPWGSRKHGAARRFLARRRRSLMAWRPSTRARTETWRGALATSPYRIEPSL